MGLASVDIALDQVSRRAIARATGYDRAHISRIFSGQRRPSIECAAKIAQHLDITLGLFWKWWVEKYGNGKDS